MNKRLPKFTTDEEAEAARKDKSINLRISERLLDAVRKEADSQGVPYQRFIRQAIVRALGASQR